MAECLPRYPKTFHIEGSGVPSASPRVPWSAAEGRNVVIEEKVDGGECAFFFDAGGGPCAQSRGALMDLSARGGRDGWLDGFKDWLAVWQDAFLGRFEDRYAVYGEWCHAARTVFYDALPDRFVEFDVLDRTTGEFLSTPRRRLLLEGLPVASAPVLYEGPAGPHPSVFLVRSAFKTERWREAMALAVSRAGLEGAGVTEALEGSDLAEGVYVKVEEGGRVARRLKWVRAEFVDHVRNAGHWATRPVLSNGVLGSEAAPARSPG